MTAEFEMLAYEEALRALDKQERLLEEVYDLQAYWDSNSREMLWLSRAFTLASAALVAEVLSLAFLLGGRHL
jgi:hypothetical protein